MEVMARAACRLEGCDPDHYSDDDNLYLWQMYATDQESILTALENAGCVVVPREATHRMKCSAGDWDRPNMTAQQWERVLSANPYAKEG